MNFQFVILYKSHTVLRQYYTSAFDNLQNPWRISFPTIGAHNSACSFSLKVSLYYGLMSCSVYGGGLNVIYCPSLVEMTSSSSCGQWCLWVGPLVMGPECVGCWLIVFISIQSVWFRGVCVCLCHVNAMCGFGNSEVPRSIQADRWGHWVNVFARAYVSLTPAVRQHWMHQKRNSQDVSVVHLKNAREKQRNCTAYPEVVFLRLLTSLLPILYFNS